MSYLNRDDTSDIGYKASVYLSAELAEYPGTLVTEKVVYAPILTGFGITAKFHITEHLTASYTYGYSDPYWEVTDTNGTILCQIQGLECNFSIRVYPMDLIEKVDIDLKQSDGVYSWVGLPESGMPKTEMTVAYDNTDNTYVGVVNGVSYNGANKNGFSITNGYTSHPIYDMGGTGADGHYEASVKYSNGANFIKDTYSYIAETTAPTGEYCFWQVLAGGNFVSCTGTNFNRGGLVDANATVGITKYPVSVKYHITERSGLSLSGLDFTDTNGNSWTGATSDIYEYKGIQSIDVNGRFMLGPHSETADPPFVNDNHHWGIWDPVPDKFGGISCSNSDELNNYTITVYDEDSDTETDYKASRVCIYCPLGNNGDLEGDMSFRFNPTVDIDTFSHPVNEWSVTGGTLTGNSITFTVEDNSLTGTGFIRTPYTGEQGALTINELIPHLPLCNRITLTGSGFDTNKDVGLLITCKNKNYRYLPIDKTSTSYVYDLTNPDVEYYRGADTASKYMSVHYPERFTGNEDDEDPNAKYYIEEEPCQFMLYGPSLFQSIAFTGFTVGTITVNKVVASYTENDTFYQFTSEFKQVEETGRQHIGGADHPIYRNRQGIIAKSGRWVEIPNNQKDVTPRGIETWRFPTLSDIEGSSGSRLLFPRDDWECISIRANTRSTDNYDIYPPVSNVVSERAYTGWIEAINTIPKIKPFCDVLDAPYLFMNDFGTELECFIDIGGYWQGFTGGNESDVYGSHGSVTFTNNSNHNSVTVSDKVQYLTQGQTDGQREYKVDNTQINITAIETPPGYICRYAIRLWGIHGKILRNLIGKILHNKVGKILRMDFKE